MVHLRASRSISGQDALACLKLFDREGEQPEVVVVRPVAMGRTWAAIASFAEIVDRLLYILVLRSADS